MMPAVLQNPENGTRGKESRMSPRQRNTHRRAALVQSLVLLLCLVLLLTIGGYTLRRYIDGPAHDLFINIAAALIGVQCCIVVNRWQEDG
jgi:hypothetical protein